MPPKGKKGPPPPPPDPRALATLDLLKDVFSDREPSLNLNQVEMAIEPEQAESVCRIAKDDPRLRFDFLSCLSVVEYNDEFQTVYHLYSTSLGHGAVFKAGAPRDNPVFASVTPVWAAAEWFEREGAELFGVAYTGHPDPRPLLLWEGFEGFPGRKEYPFAEIQIPDDIEVPQ